MVIFKGFALKYAIFCGKSQIFPVEIILKML